MLLICVQHGWDSGMTTYGKCILNRPEKHSIVFNLMEQHSLHVKFLHIYNNKIQYDTIQGTITCPLLWTHSDCQSSITDCRSEVQTAVAESRRPLSSWLCSQRPMNFTAIIPTHQCARTDVYTKLLRKLYQLAGKKTPSTLMSSHIPNAGEHHVCRLRIYLFCNFKHWIHLAQQEQQDMLRTNHPKYYIA